MSIYLALGIAYTIPLIFLYIIRKGDLFGTGKFYFVIISLIWGSVAYVLAAHINPGLIDMGFATRAEVIRFFGPIIEETLKSLILIYLVQRADFNYVVDGAIYGFGAGIGFAIFENTEYIFGNQALAVTVAIARVFSTNLVHATGSGLIGVALSTNRAEKGKGRGLVGVLLGYLFSMGLHIGFNNLVNQGVALVFAIVIGITGVGLIYFVIRRGLNTQKEWLAEKLGQSASRVTQSEVNALSKIEDLDELLTPLRQQFGVEKAEKVKLMLSRQAEMGIKTKLLDTTFNENKKKEMGEIIVNLRAEMDVLRSEIGPYCMLFVREVYLSQDLNLWGSISSRIAESSTGQKGGGLWDRATSRVQSPKLEDEDQ